MSIDFDPYVILGITSDATSDQIKAAYRRAARRLHPDINRSSPGALVQFQDITTASELLLDDERRRQYHAELKNRPLPPYVYSLIVTPSKRAVTPLDETQVIFVLVEIIPDPRARQNEQQRETRLNLTLVLDESNSMSGTRLDKVKIAAHQIIDQLHEDDILSIVSFNDFSQVVVPATTVRDKAALKARVSLMTAGGGTEIFAGLNAGIEENRKYLAPKLVNHIVLLTDGNTYGDQERCLAAAKAAALNGVIISAMGLGDEWNDAFLDDLTASTGGSCQYITSAQAVVRFMNEHVRGLSNIFADRVQLSVATDPDVQLEYAFRLAPNSQPLPITERYLALGSLQYNRTLVALLQLELPAQLATGFRSVVRLVATGDLMGDRLYKHYAISEQSIEVTRDLDTSEPPQNVMDALNKLTLYRMQQRAQEALDAGNPEEATRRLQVLTTRLLELGHGELAQQTQAEAERVQLTSTLSDSGRKSLKYGTRTLPSLPSNGD